MWAGNDEFIERYAQRAGVSTEAATEVARHLCWLFCKKEETEVELNNYLDADLYNRQIEDLTTAEKRIEELESEVEKLSKDFEAMEKERDDLEDERNNLKADLAEMSAEVTALKEEDADVQ
jgi:predicted  nucleic acid-binding Zn-ribbon protein